MSQIYSFPVGLNVKWQRQLSAPFPQPLVHDWLFNTGSLTERLQANAQTFNVELLGQQQVLFDNDISLHPDERDALPEVDNYQWQVREVVLYGNGKPWVYARSVLPDELCTTTWSSLGNQPLGQRIFNDSNFVRGDFLVASLNQHPLTKQEGVDLWARRSMFSIHAYNLLVAEVFLPDCPCYQLSNNEPI